MNGVEGCELDGRVIKGIYVYKNEEDLKNDGMVPSYPNARIGEVYSPPLPLTLEERVAVLENEILKLVSVEELKEALQSGKNSV